MCDCAFGFLSHLFQEAVVALPLATKDVLEPVVYASNKKIKALSNEASLPTQNYYKGSFLP